MSDLYREEPEMILDLVEEENKKKMEKQTAEEEVSEEDIENVLAILEKFGQSDTGRLNVHVSDEVAGGAARKVSHHGRCDVGSAWAKGEAFDVLEESKNPRC